MFSKAVIRPKTTHWNFVIDSAWSYYFWPTGHSTKTWKLAGHLFL